ncbi:MULTISPECIES: hypothetical protein [Burkholderia]|uniref:hypothetical protein n=1 Tax=Burkholderia TaxID=32008 RepID=UPI000B7AD2E0|nr:MULTISPECIES: hypothetical protein [Burkholderia]OXI94938.1 hypothetical protein CFB41_17130 [Burkholderia sp. AU33803]PRD91078.1 hypothetical protein C6P88_20725 [Burkholderia contaminans]
MSENLIRYSAYSYLQQWYRTDRVLMKALTSMLDGRVATQDLKELAVKYMVARNFNSATLSESEIAHRWNVVARHVAAAKRNANSAIDDRIHDLADKLGQVFPASDGKAPPTLLSAASKFLWFSGLYDVRIYDKRAVNALQLLQKERAMKEGRRKWRVAGNYTDFARAWKEEYDARAEDIRAALGAIDEVLDWSIIPRGTARVTAKGVVKKQWFRDRVFDKYLWTIGEDESGGLGSFS